MEWNAQEEKILKKLLEDGKTFRECAAIMARPYASIEHKSRELKFKRPSAVDGPVPLIPSKMKRPEQLALIKQLAPSIADELKRNIFKENPYPGISKAVREEESVLILSDMHTGMENSIYDPNTQTKVVTFNEEIRQKEMAYLRDSVFEIHDILSGAYRMRVLNIFILGDMITNDRIFAGQSFEIDRPCGKQVWDTVRDLAYFISTMKMKYDKIKVIGVVGNHGRSNPTMYDEPVENNFEWTMYKILQESFRGDTRVTVEVPNTKFYSTEIYGHTYYMSHGDNLRGFSRSAVDKAAKDLLTTLMLDLPAGFDVYSIGHFHASEKMDVNEKSSVLVNGSWIPRDEYGYRMFRRYSKPQQWFFGVSKNRAITWSYALDLKGMAHSKGK